MWLIVVCTLIDNKYSSLLFSQTFFVLFLHVERVCKSLARTSNHLHNAARALSCPTRCFQLSTNLDNDFLRYLWYWMSFSVALFHWFGINWDAVACILLIRKSGHKPNLESASKYGFPPIWEEKWGRSEHAHASYPGLSFRPSGLSPYMGREERRVQGLDYIKQWKQNRKAKKLAVSVVKSGRKPQTDIWNLTGFDFALKWLSMRLCEYLNKKY